MRIGIDIDETIAATIQGIIPHVATVCDVPDFGFDDMIHHDMWHIPKLGMDKAETVRIWDAWWEAEGYLIPPIDGSVEWLTYLKSMGFELYAITARNEAKRRDLTDDWIEKHFSKIFENVYFTSATSDTPKTKSSVCRELGIPLMLDDNLDYALELADNGVGVVLLNKPWNQNRSEVRQNIVRANNWSDVREYIVEYAKQHS